MSGNFPRGDTHIDNLTIRTGPSEARSAKEVEQDNSKDSRSHADPLRSLKSPLSQPNHNKGRDQSLPLPSPTYLGTDHLEPLLKSLNHALEEIDQFNLASGLEKSHVPHLQSLRRNVEHLQSRMIRVVRLAGRLYGSMGWDFKYVHASNTEGVRKLKARGGFNAYLDALEGASRRQ